MTKKRKIIYILTFLLLISSITFIMCSHFILKEDKEIKGFTYKKVSTLNYNAYDLSDFVLDVTCDKECTYQGKNIDYSLSSVDALGKNVINLSITYQGKTYEQTFDVEIIDEIAPTITLLETEVEYLKNSDATLVLESYIKEISDNFDEVSIEDVKIEEDINLKKVGDYTVTYTLTDSSNNVASSTLIFHVIEEENKKEEEETSTSQNNTNNKTNTNTNNNTNNNNSNNTSSNFKSSINSVSLSPLKTRYPTLDSKIASIISSTTNSGMSNYELLQAIYDYVKKTLSYEMMVLDLNELRLLQDEYSYYDYDGLDIMRANYSLQTKKGVCDNYAALFMILARRIGFDAYVVGGSVNKASGGTTDHAWVMIKAGTKYYIFDPQIEDSKGTSYNYFGKTDSELPIYHYNLSSNISKFHYFKENPNLAHMYTLYVNITGAYDDEVSLTNGYSRTSMTNLDLGSSVSFKLHTDITQKYTVELSLNDKVISTEEWDGRAKTINHTFNTLGQEKFSVAVYAGSYRLEYVLDMTIEEPKKASTEEVEN